MLPLSGSSDGSTSFPELARKRCKLCKEETLFAFQRYVNCQKCRDRINSKEQEKRYRKKLREMQSAMDRNCETENNISRATPCDTTTLVRHDSPRKALESADDSNLPQVQKADVVTTKPPISFRDLDGKEKDAAIAAMKYYVKRQVRKRGITVVSKLDQNPSAGTEYQTASALYSAVKSAVLSEGGSKPRFKGFHTIVATPDITHKQRVELVAADLAKIAKAQFDRHQPFSRQRTKDETMRITTYLCTCQGFEAAHLPKPTKARDLIKWARMKKRAAAVGADGFAPARIECNGTVKIVVKADLKSHPSGIVGQQIAIEIDHPPSY